MCRLGHGADDLPSINHVEEAPKYCSKSTFVSSLNTAFGQNVEKPKGLLPKLFDFDHSARNGKLNVLPV